MKLKNKGFTLVEIIVSIAIGSIVLMIAGAMILSSSNFMRTTTDTDLNKRSVDSLIDFVRSEIVYATDVRFVPVDSKLVPDYEKDKDWHYLYVKDGELYRDGVRLFDKNFTNHNRLSIHIMGSGTSETNHRLDIKYSLQDDQKESVYSSRDTVMFLNLSVSDAILNEGLYSSQYIELSNNGYWLYYTSKVAEQVVVPSDNSKGDGTVADIRYLINSRNLRGSYAENRITATNYSPGEIVWYNGYWWQNTGWSNKTTPGTNYAWKRLTREYSHPELGEGENNKFPSSYETGDIVCYKNKYYEAKGNMESAYDAKILVGNEVNWSWKLIGDVGNKEAENYLKLKEYKNRSIYKYETILDKYLPENIDWTDASHKDFDSFIPNKKYKKGDIVRAQSNDDNTYWNLYIKNANFNSTTGPNIHASAGWTKIDISYDNNSYYSLNDIVSIRAQENMWVMATVNIAESFTDLQIAQMIWGNNQVYFKNAPQSSQGG